MIGYWLHVHLLINKSKIKWCTWSPCNHSELRFSLSIILNHRIKYSRQMPSLIQVFWRIILFFLCFPCLSSIHQQPLSRVGWVSNKYINTSKYLAIYLSIYLSIICQSIYLSIYLIILSINVSIFCRWVSNKYINTAKYISIYLSVYLSLYPSIHLSINLSITLSIYLFI